MAPVKTLILSLFATIAAVPATAQQDFSAVEIRTEQVIPGIAVLFGAGGNIAVSYGADGTVLIDDQYAPLTERIQAAVAALGATPTKYLINTHWHGDHSGGNENFGRAGAIIMAQDHVRDRMARGQIMFGRTIEPAPAVALPVITWHNGITVHLNGQRIRTHHMPHAHTDGDSVVWFQDANVFHMGDLYLNQVSLPFIDLSSGGDVRGVLAAVEHVLTIANDDSVIIPGHGPLARRSDLVGYRDMLASVIGAVATARAEGKTLEQIVAMHPAAQWDTNPDAFIKGDFFVTSVFNSLESGMFAAASESNHHEAAAPASEHGHDH